MDLKTFLEKFCGDSVCVSIYDEGLRNKGIGAEVYFFLGKAWRLKRYVNEYKDILKKTVQSINPTIGGYLEIGVN